MTRAAFHEMFAQCDTRSEIEELIALTAKRVAPREQIALQVAGTRRCMEILFKDLKVWIQELFDESNPPLEAIDRRLTAKDHEQD